MTLARIVLVALVEGSFGVFFRVSESAALPQVVPKEQLPQAIAQNQARRQGAGIVSQPVLGAAASSASSPSLLSVRA